MGTLEWRWLASIHAIQLCISIHTSAPEGHADCGGAASGAYMQDWNQPQSSKVLKQEADLWQPGGGTMTSTAAAVIKSVFMSKVETGFWMWGAFL